MKVIQIQKLENSLLTSKDNSPSTWDAESLKYLDKAKIFSTRELFIYSMMLEYGFTVKEIALALKITPSAVYLHIAKIRSKLEKILK